MKLLGRDTSALLIGTLLLCHGVFGALHLVCDPLEWCIGGAQHSAEHQTAPGAGDAHEHHTDHGGSTAYFAVVALGLLALILAAPKVCRRVADLARHALACGPSSGARRIASPTNPRTTRSSGVQALRSTSLRQRGSEQAVPEASHNKGVVLKTLLMKAWPLALLLAVAFLLAACGDAGSGQQGDGSAGGGHGQMDHGQMGHGSMGMGSGGMAKQMIMENGNTPTRRSSTRWSPPPGCHSHGRGSPQERRARGDNELSRNIISSQQAEIEELKSIKQEEFGTSNVPMEMSQEQMRGMGMMMDPQRLSKREPFDEAFIDAMIPHHRSAIRWPR